MNEQLIKFIELCLTDGVITDKEREVIFRKATEYNVDIDECEIILDSMIQQKTIIKNKEHSINKIEVIKPKFSGYKYNLAVDEGFVEISIDDEEDFQFMFNSFLEDGFDSVVVFLKQLNPQDEFVIELIKKYSSESEKIKSQDFSEDLSIKNDIDLENPVTGEKYSLIIAKNDFPKKMNWSEAKRACSNLGKGWRLPTIKELEVICKTIHKNGKGNFQDDAYWSIDENTVVNSAYYFHFKIEQSDYIDKKEGWTNARAVKQV